MSGMYWGLTAMELMGRLGDMDTAKILDWVRLRGRALCMLWGVAYVVVAYSAAVLR
jgi:hypothetical protein